MLTARNYMFPEIKTKGYCNFGKKLTVFTSSSGHYSVEKTGMALGLGLDNIIKVPCDDQGRMRPDELGKILGKDVVSFGIYEITFLFFIFFLYVEQLIIQSLKRKETPFFINATAGTTVLV